MVKLVDMTWIADKSLDVYCEKTIKQMTIPHITSANSKSVSSSVKKIFTEVLELAVSEYEKTFDKVLIAVPCFPITRMDKIVMMSRFLCNNSDFLSENGISSSQFQETFEKFLYSICKNEYITNIGNKTFILNRRGVLYKEWRDSILRHFGSSLVNEVKDFPFDSNPDFIINFEFGKGKFTEMSREEKYKVDLIIENLTKN